MTTLTFEVDGLSCGACAARAEKAMSAVAGVHRAEVNFATHGAVVDVADAGGGLLLNVDMDGEDQKALAYLAEAR